MIAELDTFIIRISYTRKRKEMIEGDYSMVGRNRILWTVIDPSSAANA